MSIRALLSAEQRNRLFARRSLLVILGQGGSEARQELSIALSRAVTQVAHSVIKRQLLEKAIAAGVEPSPGGVERSPDSVEPSSEQDILDEAVAAVERHRARHDRMAY